MRKSTYYIKLIFSYLVSKIIGGVRRIAPQELRGPLQDLKTEIFYYIAHLRSITKVEGLFSSSGPVNLELGAGNRHMPGWISVDFAGDADLQLDLRKPLPMPSKSVDRIYSSHVLEHFSYPNPLSSLIEECFRVLKPGGVFDVAVPDGSRYLRAYVLRQKIIFDVDAEGVDARHLRCPMNQVSWFTYMGGHHKNLFDAENLTLVLQDAGFVDIHVRRFESSVDLERRQQETLYIIAVKP